MIQRDHAALLKPGSRLLAVGLTIGMWSDGVTGSRAFYYQLFFLWGENHCQGQYLLVFRRPWRPTAVFLKVTPFLRLFRMEFQELNLASMKMGVGSVWGREQGGGV